MDFFWHGFIKGASEKKPEALARVALIDTVNRTLLMGRRKDNKRWTITSGHLEGKETPIEGAVREVKEEAGITVTPEQLKSIGSNKGKKEDGTPITVHGFYVPYSGQTPRAVMGHDPDDEMSVWRWESLANGLPKDIEENLHIPLQKDKVIQWALGRLADSSLQKAASRSKIMRLMSPDDLAVIHNLRQKLLSEGPQQYAQNYDAIQSYRSERKRSRNTKTH